MNHAYSVNAFFNSAYQEIEGCKTQGNLAIFPLSEQSHLELVLSFASIAGRHRYTNQAYLVTNGEKQEITYQEAAKELTFAHFTHISDETKHLFLQRVNASDQYIQNTKYASRPSTFIESEQSLYGGHNMHPAPKACEPLTQEETKQYLPEFSATFNLEWFGVRDAHFKGESFVNDAASQLHALAQEEGITAPDGLIPFPMHPLQAQAWRTSDAKTALGDQIIDLNQTSSGWTATSSTRAIYKPGASYLIKCSLPVKLTNSVRLLSEKEVKRGTFFSDLLHSKAGEQMRQRLNNTTFIEEPTWASITDQNGQVIDLSIITLRENIFDLKQDTQLLATLNQVSLNEQSLTGYYIERYAQAHQLDITHAAKQWFSAFFDAVIRPLCVARSDYGFVVLAHQQNILVDFENNLPTGMKYKDCQGTGLTSGGLKAFEEVLNGNSPEYFMESPGVNPFFAYYLIGNTLMNTVAAIAGDGLCKEQDLYAICQIKFDELRRAPTADASFYEYMLDSDTLLFKGNFQLFMSNVNECTIEVPTTIYRNIPNPVHVTGNQSACVYKPLLDGRTVRFDCIDAQSTEFNVTSTDRLTQVQFNLAIEGDVATLTGNDALTQDEQIWLSAIEHVLMSANLGDTAPILANVNQIKLVNAPSLYADDQVNRLAFIQDPRLWCVPHHAHTGERTKAKTDIEHPVRPEKQTGVVFQRYFYPLNQTLRLRMLDIPRDIEMFHRWHNREDIAPVWELEGDTAFHTNYLSEMEKDPHQFAVVGEYNTVPFGYIEIYWAAEDRIGPFYEPNDFDQGVHVLVGNLDYRGMEFGYVWGSSMLHYCFLKCAQTQHVVGEPRADNERAVRASALVGLIKQYEFDFPHKRAALTKCVRERFFNEFVIK